MACKTHPNQNTTSSLHLILFIIIILDPHHRHLNTIRDTDYLGAGVKAVTRGSWTQLTFYWKPSIMASVACSTLADIFSMVPNFLHSYALPQWQTRVDGIKQLRLVSKEIGRVAAQALQNCSVDLGHDPFSNHSARVGQVARLVGRAQLRRLVVRIAVLEGEAVFQVN